MLARLLAAPVGLSRAMRSVHTLSSTPKPVQHQQPRLRLYKQREEDGLLQHCAGVEHMK